MKLPGRWLLIVAAAVLVAAAAIAALALNSKNERSNTMQEVGNPTATTTLEIISPVFRDGAPIPTQYSCKGQNVSPPLNFINVPKAAKSLALIMHDPDAPVGDFVHWTMWDIPVSTETLVANSVPVGAVQGVTSFGDNKYGGPCPPSGTHRYMFELYALDTNLGLPSNTERDDLKKAIKGHILEQHTLVGTFSSD